MHFSDIDQRETAPARFDQPIESAADDGLPFGSLRTHEHLAMVMAYGLILGNAPEEIRRRVRESWPEAERVEWNRLHVATREILRRHDRYSHALDDIVYDLLHRLDDEGYRDRLREKSPAL